MLPRAPLVLSLCASRWQQPPLLPMLWMRAALPRLLSQPRRVLPPRPGVLPAPPCMWLADPLPLPPGVRWPSPSQLHRQPSTPALRALPLPQWLPLQDGGGRARDEPGWLGAGCCTHVMRRAAHGGRCHGRRVHPRQVVPQAGSQAGRQAGKPTGRLAGWQAGGGAGWCRLGGRGHPPVAGSRRAREDLDPRIWAGSAAADLRRWWAVLLCDIFRAHCGPCVPLCPWPFRRRDLQQAA